MTSSLTPASCAAAASEQALLGCSDSNRLAELRPDWGARSNEQFHITTLESKRFREICRQRS